MDGHIERRSIAGQTDVSTAITVWAYISIPLERETF